MEFQNTQNSFITLNTVEANETSEINELLLFEKILKEQKQNCRNTFITGQNAQKILKEVKVLRKENFALKKNLFQIKKQTRTAISQIGRRIYEKKNSFTKNRKP